MERRTIGATIVAFGVSDGRPYLSVLSKDQRETIEVQIDDLDVARIAEKSTAYLAERFRRK